MKYQHDSRMQWELVSLFLSLATNSHSPFALPLMQEQHMPSSSLLHTSWSTQDSSLCSTKEIASIASSIAYLALYKITCSLCSSLYGLFDHYCDFKEIHMHLKSDLSPLYANMIYLMFLRTQTCSVWKCVAYVCEPVILWCWYCITGSVLSTNDGSPLPALSCGGDQIGQGTCTCNLTTESPIYTNALM